MEFTKYVSKPRYVTGVKVTYDNIEEVAKWCKGQVRINKRKLRDDHGTKTIEEQYIKVEVRNPLNDRQTMAFVGDHLLFSEDRGGSFKVYHQRALEQGFDVVESEKV